ncbi:MAG: Crp/Fnr family transcriptional regulator [Chloroflexi bacterium]|nr:Crp/Fnr family transcriptional regulator [Chloroflexota bacterium]
MDSETRDFLSSLRPDDIAELNELGTVRAFARGQTLFHENQLPDRVLIVRRGVIKVTSMTSAGREVVLAFRGAGEILGELAALDGEPRSATVRSVEAGEALSLSAEAFRGFLEARPSVAIVLLQMQGRRLRDADAKRIEFSTYTTIERVAVRLLEFSERFGLEDASGAVRITLPLTQDELAGATGSSIESVGRALQTMRTLNCIETGRREIRVIDPQGLAALLADP